MLATQTNSNHHQTLDAPGAYDVAMEQDDATRSPDEMTHAGGNGYDTKYDDTDIYKIVAVKSLTDDEAKYASKHAPRSEPNKAFQSKVELDNGTMAVPIPRTIKNGTACCNCTASLRSLGNARYCARHNGE